MEYCFRDAIVNDTKIIISSYTSLALEQTKYFTSMLNDRCGFQVLEENSNPCRFHNIRKKIRFAGISVSSL